MIISFYVGFMVLIGFFASIGLSVKGIELSVMVATSFFGFWWVDDDANRNGIRIGRGLEFMVICLPIIGFGIYAMRRYRIWTPISYIAYILVLLLGVIVCDIVYLAFGSK